MFLFKKKKPTETTGDKFKNNTAVQVHHNNDFVCATVISSRRDNDGTIIYNLNVGGECPFLINNVKEKDIVKLK